MKPNDQQQSPRWQVHANAADMATALSQHLQQLSHAAIADHGTVRIGLAGGSTPMAAYADFAAAAMPWPQVRLALIDERCVPLSDAQSNERAIAAAFAGVRAQLGAWQGLYSENVDVAAAADAAVRAFGLPLDITVIGMGADGHIASLFVESGDYDAAIDASTGHAVLPMRFAPGDGKTDRLSFTLPALLQTRRVLFCISGADKREVLERSLDGRAPHYAVARFLAGYDGPVDIFWSPA
jgi:6-phosphogluconolactonase